MEVMATGEAGITPVAAKPGAAEVKGAFAAKLKESAGAAKKKPVVAKVDAKDKGGAEGNKDVVEDGKVDGAMVQPAAAGIEALPVTRGTALPIVMDGKQEAGQAAVKAASGVEKKAVVGAAVEPPAKVSTGLEVGQAVAPVAEKTVASPMVVAAVNGLALQTVGPVSAGKGAKVVTTPHVEGGRSEVVRAPEEAQVVLTAGNVLEVGVAGGVHGWLRVRAEMSEGGEVSAQVIAASAGAAENLHKEMPAMQAYLATEQVGVSSLVVNAAEKGEGAQDAAMAFSGGQSFAEQSFDGQAKGGTEERALWQEQADVEVSSGMASGLQFGLVNGVSGQGSGGWLSVRV